MGVEAVWLWYLWSVVSVGVDCVVGGLVCGGCIGVEIWWTVSLVDWFVWVVWARVSVDAGRWSRRNQCRCCVWLVHKF